MWSIATLHTSDGISENLPVNKKMFSKSAKMTVIYSSATILLILLNLLAITSGLPIEKNDSDGSASALFESFEGFDEHHHGYDEELHGEPLGDYHESFGHEQEYQHEHAHDFGSNHLDIHSDFDDKPVPGIDHGKGAFSYSSTYEFKDADQHKHDFEHSF